MGNQWKEFFDTPEQEITTAMSDEEDYESSNRELKLVFLRKICYKND